MKGLLFAGKREEFTRPVNLVDESLMRRIVEARQRLGDTPVKPLRNPLLAKSRSMSTGTMGPTTFENLESVHQGRP